jgi:tagatose-6-phosphate ketose/aldose isomerase
LDKLGTAGAITRTEIFQQPALWETTLARVREFDSSELEGDARVVITGAGTSAHASTAVATAWHMARAIPTTDLLIARENYFEESGILLSLARSGESPESVGVVRRIQKLYPSVRHFAITCNAEGRLAHHTGVKVLLLDPRTNDHSLVMTSSFSNLILAGLALRHLPILEQALPDIAASASKSLPEMDELARDIAARQFSRATILASRPLMAAAREASLKILEMTAGGIPVLTETYLGLRHGPMSFLRDDTLVLCFLSTSPEIRRYELDLLGELRAKNIGYIVAIAPPQLNELDVNQRIPSLAPELADNLRTPFEIIFAQLLGWHLSLGIGLNPDNPSPQGVINRVVQGVRIHED